MTIKILNSAGLFCILFTHIATASQPITDYLLKPTGQYNVAFKGIHWVNNTICPDPNYSKANQKNFSSGNKKYCHELNKESISITHAKYAEGNGDFNNAAPFIFQVMIKTMDSLERKTIAQFNDKNDANLFVVCKFEDDNTVHDNDLFLGNVPKVFLKSSQS
jgi:hypothetical protein